jgi:hypothetical protein
MRRHVQNQVKWSQQHGHRSQGEPKGRLEMNGEMSVASTRRPSSARTVTASGTATTSSLPSSGTCAFMHFKNSTKVCLTHGRCKQGMVLHKPTQHDKLCANEARQRQQVRKCWRHFCDRGEGLCRMRQMFSCFARKPGRTLSYTPASMACSRVDLPLKPPPTAAAQPRASFIQPRA